MVFQKVFGKGGFLVLRGERAQLLAEGPPRGHRVSALHAGVPESGKIPRGLRKEVLGETAGLMRRPTAKAQGENRERDAG